MAAPHKQMTLTQVSPCRTIEPSSTKERADPRICDGRCMALFRAKRILAGALAGAFVVNADIALAQIVDQASEAPPPRPAEFGNLDEPAAGPDPVPTFENAESADRPRLTIQNGFISGGEAGPVEAPSDVIVTAIESADRIALFKLLRSECQEGCGPRLDAADVLHAAAALGDTAVVDMLIALGGNVNDRAIASGWTPLMTALYTMNTDMARHLLSSGADPGVIGNDGTTTAFLANLAGLGELIPYPKLEIAPEEADMLLLRAIEAGSLPYVELALASGGRASATAENGWSALMIASFRGEVGAVERLIAADRGIVNYAEPKSGLTAAHATLVGLVDPQDREKLVLVLRKLGAAGADMSRLSNAGVSPLDVARNQKHGAEVEALVTDLIAGVQSQEDTLSEAVPVATEPEDPREVWNGAGYLKQNLNLRSGPSTEVPIVELLLTGDRVEIRERLTDGWVKVMAPTGATGFIRERYLSDVPVSTIQFGAVCMDTLRGFNYLHEVQGRPSSAKAKEDVLALLSNPSNCDSLWEFSGEECYAIAFTGDDLKVANNFLVSIQTSRDKAQSEAWSYCTTFYGAACKGIEVICATPERK